jgi:hypothetical protein
VNQRQRKQWTSLKSWQFQQSYIIILTLKNCGKKAKLSILVMHFERLLTSNDNTTWLTKYKDSIIIEISFCNSVLDTNTDYSILTETKVQYCWLANTVRNGKYKIINFTKLVYYNIVRLYYLSNDHSKFYFY